LRGQRYNKTTTATTCISKDAYNNIEYRAFSNCKELKDIYCYASNVPQTDENAFGDYNYDISYIENATLHVPVASLEAYRQTAPWSGFGKIVALTDDDPKPTKVYSATTDDKYPQFSVYTINGRRISKPQRGLNILRMSNGTTKKVMACTRGQERCVN
jgi:hypothetical protein